MATVFRFNPFTSTFDVVETVDTSAFAPAIPLTIAAGATWTNPANSQAVYAIPITNNGSIVNNGQIVMVRSA